MMPNSKAFFQNILIFKIKYQTKKIINMIIVPLKEGENIERALKRFKRKFERTGVVKELRKRQAFIKPSVDRRKKRQHAVYVQQMQEDED